MGYKIVYGPVQETAPKRTGRGGRLRTMTALFFLLGCLSVRTLWPEGASLLRVILLPGTPTATEAAFSEMMTALRDGEPVSETVAAFCRVVVENGTVLEP